jgi:hypothetical protein
MFPTKKQTGASPFTMELHGERPVGQDSPRLSREFKDLVVEDEKELTV